MQIESPSHKKIYIQIFMVKYFLVETECVHLCNRGTDESDNIFIRLSTFIPEIIYMAMVVENVLNLYICTTTQQK